MDPRIERTRKAVIDAATDLLVEGGPQALTMDAVVARSGVAKSTLYRHWDTRDALVADVFEVCAPVVTMPEDPATSEEGLRTLVRSLAEAMSEEHWNRLAPALILLARELPELADLDSDMKTRQNEATGRVLQMGVDEGRLHPSVLDDVERTITLLAGPVIFAGLAGITAVDDALADACVDQFLAGQAALLAAS